MRSVLVVAYYTPPLGMSGVMRVTKLVKFLPRYGWQPVVLTVRKIAYFLYDEGLLADWPGIRVFRSRSLDPARLRFLLMPGRPLAGFDTGTAGWLANVLCFPDAKAGWMPFALRLGKRIIAEEKPSAIFATAPPFTALMVGAALKRSSGLPLVSDFRDPWPMGLVPPPRLLRARVERLRGSIVSESDAVLAVNEGTALGVRGQGSEVRVEVLENGFDPDEFQVTPRQFARPTLLYVGNVWQNEAELRAVLDATRSLDLQVALVGKSSSGFKSQVQNYGHFADIGLLSHAETIAAMKGADGLLYLGKPQQPVGIKLYEYLGAGKPVLSVAAQPSEADQLIREHGAGLTAPPEPGAIRAAISQLRGSVISPVGLERFNRQFQAERLARILDRVSPRSSA